MLLSGLQTSLGLFFFPRGMIPPNIQQPDPNTWGKPYAYFTLGQNCPESHFQNQTMVINLTFCGDFAGGLNFYNACPQYGKNCTSFVLNNPSNFKEAYWLINYISVFQQASK